MASNERGKINYTKINTKDMSPHPIAQRKFDQKHGDWLAKNFSWDSFKPIDVSFRDGKYWVIDGQHRLYAIRKRNKGNDISVLCRVHYGMTVLDEADFFLDQSKGQKIIKITDKLNVLYKIGDESTKKMVDGAIESGWIVDFSTHKANNRIIALSTLRKVYNCLSYEQYTECLKAIKKAWDGDSDSICREIMLGMGLFFQTYWGKFNANSLAKNLSKVSPLQIIRDGRSVGANRGSNNKNLNIGRPYARCILREYNSGRRAINRLEDVF